MAPNLSLPPLEFCLGTSPIQAEKSRPDRNALGSATQATSAVASAGPTPGIASSRLLAAFDRCHAMIRRSNSRLCVFNMRSCAPRAATQGACNIRHPLIAGVGHHLEKLLHASASDRRDDAELGKMRSDGVDHGGLLTNEQMARAMKHQTALLLGCFRRNKAHVRPRDRLTDCLGIGGIVLLSFHVGLYVGRWHQPHRVT